MYNCLQSNFPGSTQTFVITPECNCHQQRQTMPRANSCRDFCMRSALLYEHESATSVTLKSEEISWWNMQPSVILQSVLSLGAKQAELPFRSEMCALKDSVALQGSCRMKTDVAWFEQLTCGRSSGGDCSKGLKQAKPKVHQVHNTNFGQTATCSGLRACVKLRICSRVHRILLTQLNTRDRNA